MARLALGAYVVARLVDKLLAIESDPGAVEGFRWQLEAVRRHVADLPPDAPETAHLAGVVAAVPSEGRPVANLWMSLTAYAYFLEHEGRLEEGLEMLNLAARSQGTIGVADYTAYALFAARLNRRLARWDLATACYDAAEETAIRSGDAVARLRGRLGKGAVHRGRGNLPLAQSIAEGVVREASDENLPNVQSMAYLDLGAVYTAQGMRLEALKAYYQAFRLNNEMPEQMRALGELALGLSEIGAFDAARLAFQIVAESNASAEVRINARIELMDLESSVGNRVSFERHRAVAEEHRGRMSPSMSVDYLYKVGVGLARFGQAGRARTTLTSALELAEKHRLNVWYFKVEQMLGKLTDGSNEQPRQASTLSEAPAVREMEVGLREYAALTAV